MLPKRTRLSTVIVAARVVDCGPSGLSESAELLARGGLVAFPTETVYGLGANALNVSSVAAIFAAKQRPATDPLIVHISDKSEMYALFDFGSAEAQRVCEVLTDKFWPGPLTIIHKASSSVPALVTSNTGFVGLRSPQHSVARALLRLSKLPIAAPSANRFGHVSPTSAEHVMSDLGQTAGLVVIDDDPNITGGCQVGIESTVCRVSSDGGIVTVLRCGAVTGESIAQALGGSIRVQMGNNHLLTVRTSGGHSYGSESEGQVATSTLTVNSRGSVNANTNRGIEAKAAATVEAEEEVAAEAEVEAEAEAEAVVAPGQMLKHYSPDLPTFIVTSVKPDCSSSSSSAISSASARSSFSSSSIVKGSACKNDEHNENGNPLLLSQCLVLDFGGSLRHLQEGAAWYYDLSPSGTTPEAYRQVFSWLRAAESAAAKSRGVQAVLLPNLEEEATRSQQVRALWERLHRAASGVGVTVAEK